MLLFPLEKCVVKVNLLLKNGNKRNEVIERFYAVLPLEENFKSSLALLLDFLVDDRRFSTCKQACLMAEKMFNAWRRHSSCLGWVEMNAEMNPAETHHHLLVMMGRCKDQLKVTLMNAIVCVTKKPCNHHELMQWFLCAMFWMVLIDKLLTAYGQKHSNTSTNNDCKTRMHLSVH